MGSLGQQLAMIQFIIGPHFVGLGSVILLAWFSQPRKRGIGVGALFYLISIVVGVWAISRSRSSTAGIGVLFLPFPAALSGLLGVLFWKFRTEASKTLRKLSWLSFVLALGIPGFQIYQGVATIHKNRVRDAEAEVYRKKIGDNKEMIQSILKANPGREKEVLTRLIEENISDPSFLIPALETPYVSTELLDRLSLSSHLGVALTVARNPKTQPETLARLYRDHSYPDYFFQALASHPNTPPGILTEIYRRPRTITGLNLWFARNPSTPREILLELSKELDVNVIQGLLQNPKLDCELLRNTEQSLGKSNRPEDSSSRSRIQELEKALCGQKR